MNDFDALTAELPQVNPGCRMCGSTHKSVFKVYTKSGSVWMCLDRAACRDRRLVNSTSAQVEGLNSEMAAVAACCAVFDNLNRAGRRRVLAYLNDFYTPRSAFRAMLGRGQR